MQCARGAGVACAAAAQRRGGTATAGAAAGPLRVTAAPPLPAGRRCGGTAWLAARRDARRALAGCGARQAAPVRRSPALAAAAAAAAAAAHAPPQRVFLAGVTSAFGLQLIALFAAQGCHVTVLCRDASSRDALLAAGASSVVVADALDAAAASAAVAAASPSLILSAVGTSPPEPICSDADAKGTAALVAAAVAHAPAARFVLVSALGVGESLECLPHASHDVLIPWLERKEKAEAALQASGLEWTVLRPGPLTDAPRSGLAVATLDAVTGKAFSTLSRADLAYIAYQACVSPAACRRTLAVLDGGSVIIAAPFLRQLEAWEAAPFDEFAF